MKFYIASKLSNADMVDRLAGYLKDGMWEQTYDWTAHGSVQEETQAVKERVARAETKGVLDADVFILLLPGGRGTHVELGLAIIACEHIFVWADEPENFKCSEGYECSFYYHPKVRKILCAFDELAEKLLELEDERE